MPFFSMFVWGTRRTSLPIATLMIALIAVIDAHVAADLPLGFLYLAPMLVVGAALSRWEIGASAAICALLAEYFDEFPWGPNTGLPRDLLYFAAFFCMGLFMHEVTRSRRLSARHMWLIEAEMTARRDAEEQLKVLVDSSPAAIITTSSDGSILLANDAANRLFGLEPGTLPGLPIRDFLPSLFNAAALDSSRQAFRTAMQCRGRRADGEVFQADVWFSTYITSAGPGWQPWFWIPPKICEPMRNQASTRCWPARASWWRRFRMRSATCAGPLRWSMKNLARSGKLKENKDFETLGTLVLALERIAAMDLRQTTSDATGVEVHSLLDELRIVIEAALREAGFAHGGRWNRICRRSGLIVRA